MQLLDSVTACHSHSSAMSGRGGRGRGRGRGGFRSGGRLQGRPMDDGPTKPPKVNLSEVEQLVREASTPKEKRKARLDQIIALGARPTTQQRGKISLPMLQGMRRAHARREKRLNEEKRQMGIVAPTSASTQAPYRVPNLKKRKRDLATSSHWSQLRGDRAGISGTVADPESRRALKPHIGRYQDGVVTISSYQINRAKRTKLN